MKYVVTIGQREMEVVVDGESVTIDGETVHARLEEPTGAPVKLLTIGRSVHRILARRGAHRGQYEIRVGGHSFTIEALDERSRAIRELGGTSGAKAGPAHVVAPMPGLIVRVNVSEGDVIRTGQGVVVMEAMKMENELRAPADAVVKRVAVTPGTAVEKGAMLLELETDAQ